MIVNLNFKKNNIIAILLTSFAIILAVLIFFHFEKSFAHNFSPDESAHFLTLVDKIKVESELVANSQVLIIQVQLNTTLIMHFSLMILILKMKSQNEMRELQMN